MKKTVKFILIFLSGYILFSCSYDDDALWSEIKNIKADVASLKKQASSLQTVVDALNKGKIITEVKESADKKGHTVTFNDGKIIEIVNGKDAPVLGIEEFENVYYWTITKQGEKDFLLDKGGNKIPVSGKDGETPVLEIDKEGYWTVNGVQIKDGNGNPVKAQGDSFFKEVQKTETEVTFVLADGSTLTLPMSGGTYLSFVTKGDASPFFVFKVGERKRVKIKFANIKSLKIIKKPEGWRANLHEPGRYVELVAPQDASYGIQEVVVRGLDKNGMVFQAIAQVSVSGKAFSDALGLFILNEGNMTTENGSLIYITPEGEVLDRAYYNMNGRELGNVCQDLFIKDGKMYIISQNGRKNAMGNSFVNDGMLVVANSETLQKEVSYNDELKVLSWPTHLAVLDEKNIFIRDNKGVYLFNSVSKELTYIEGTKGADKNTMAVVNNRVFVPAKKNIFVFEANNPSIVQTIDMGDRISGVLKSKDGNIWVSTTGSPNKISKIDSKTYGVIKANEITEGKVGKGWGSTPGITAKGDTLYYSNASTKIYRHIFSKAESTLMADAKTMVKNANIVYNNIAVHPVTGKVYMNTLKAYGWDFLVNNISEFDFSGTEPVLTNNYTNYTHFPAGIFFSHTFK